MTDLVEVIRPAAVAIALTNDLLSYKRESPDAEDSGQSHVFNLVWVLMQLRAGMTAEEAKSTYREIIRNNVAEYLDASKAAKTLGTGTYSVDFVRFLDEWHHFPGGTIVWHAFAPRYHHCETLSEGQLDWMTNGIPARMLERSV
ncbi:isoprenoid synthase domain-containing protein [Podospora didyma]|uniref:Isoprenoid synthase domain-containing protein n=1 Tax=Podospora didyma TaxID=330526 RepID=A0AAE0NYL2_9PEZI|nr:isoprenoid synthase domain-containing protein [Podospora didyma]